MMTEHMMATLRRLTGLGDEAIVQVAIHNAYVAALIREARRDDLDATGIMDLMYWPSGADHDSPTPDGDMPGVGESSPPDDTVSVRDGGQGAGERVGGGQDTPEPSEPPQAPPEPSREPTAAERLAAQARVPDDALRHRVLRLAAKQTEPFSSADLADHSAIRSTAQAVGTILGRAGWSRWDGPGGARWLPRLDN